MLWYDILGRKRRGKSLSRNLARPADISNRGDRILFI